jgi:glycosyltransferase involved in cell wall biosynthesis
VGFKINRMGVSIVVCCFNSATRLPKVIEHLIKQVHVKNIPWEVIIVDNASTDMTAEVAKSLWPQDFAVPMSVHYESRPGLSHARQRGILESNCEIISFIDDDNWVCPSWVSTVMRVMFEHPEVGACGGRNEQVTEAEQPEWFELYRGCYAVGEQKEITGDLTWTRGYLWGAGLTIRKRAWQQLIEKGFSPLLKDRSGFDLTSGGDTELCLALRLAGWRLWYESDLSLKHYLPLDRLNWKYLRKLNRGFGMASVDLDPYKISANDFSKLINILKSKWIINALYITLRLLKCLKYLIRYERELFEADEDIITTEVLIGRFF